MAYIESGKYQSPAQGNVSVISQYGLLIDSVGYFVSSINRQVFWSEYNCPIKRKFLPQLTKNQNLAITDYRIKNNLAGSKPFIIALENGEVKELKEYKVNSLINRWDRSTDLDTYIRSIFNARLYQYYIPFHLTRPVEYGRMPKLQTRGNRGKRKR